MVQAKKSGAIHISARGKNAGNPAACNAQHGCRLKTDAPHFDTIDEANDWIQEQEAKNNDPFSVVKKSNKSSKSKNPAMTEIRKLKKEIAELQKDVNTNNSKVKKGKNRIAENNNTISAMDNMNLDKSVKDAETKRLTDENAEIEDAIKKTEDESRNKHTELKKKTKELDSLKKEFEPKNDTTVEARKTAYSYSYSSCGSSGGGMSC